MLRLFAASQVVVTHVGEHLGLHPKEGAFAWLYNFLGMFPGVPIFFVISGFLISRSFEARRNDLRSYAVNRGLRIFPGLWVCFGVSLLCMAVLGALRPQNVATPSFLAYLVGQLTVFQFYTPAFLKPYGVGNPNGSLWTIPVEIQFYCILPILYALGRNLKAKSFDILLIVGAVASFASTVIMLRPESTVTKLFAVTFIPHVWLFFVGVLIQRNYSKWSNLLEGKGLWWLAGFTVVRAAVAPLNSQLAEWATHAILAFAVVSLAYTHRDAARKVLREVDISYGVYLYHMVIINVLVETGFIGPGLPVVVAVLGTALAAYLSFRFVERPALSLKGRFMKTNQSPAKA